MIDRELMDSIKTIPPETFRNAFEKVFTQRGELMRKLAES